ncbi:17377_t:CDS:2 [Acaulospora colombiana]|uniref:17377_t:CDS:1 n=1 Tax=Acaulospora colombiana TaxID=27376 RepID=A0ACA9LGV8_9GLOM|nr:17377_t:CDS:2 [Acaulospora colombiana]
MKKIQECDYSFPDDFDPVIRTLVERCLVNNPTVRITSGELRDHSFFSSVDWDTLWKQTPPTLQHRDSPAVGRTKKLMPTIVANTSPRQLSSDASPPSPGATTSTQEERTAKTEKRPPVAWPQRPGQDPSELTAHLKKTAIQYPYSVPRNSNGCEDLLHTLSLFYEPSLETCALTLFAKALKDDLVATLFPDTRNNRFMNHRLATNIRVHHNRHVIIQGGQWAKQVQKWLLARGF